MTLKVNKTPVTVNLRKNLTFRDHISEKINKAYSVLGIIKNNFVYMDEHTFILLYKALVRPHVEFCYLCLVSIQIRQY